MKLFIVLALFVAAAVAAPVDSKNAETEYYEFDNIGADGYKFAVKTSDGKSFAEEGSLQNPGTEDEGIEVRGEFSYPGVDGNEYFVRYTAGKAGFQPIGAHLPKAIN